MDEGAGGGCGREEASLQHQLRLPQLGSDSLLPLAASVWTTRLEPPDPGRSRLHPSPGLEAWNTGVQGCLNSASEHGGEDEDEDDEPCEKHRDDKKHNTGRPEATQVRSFQGIGPAASTSLDLV